MADLTTIYMGLTLGNPLIVSASPLAGNLDNIKQMEAAGAGAIALPSIFEEQIKLEHSGLDYYQKTNPDLLPAALRHVPEMTGYNKGLNGYLAHLFAAKKAVNIPIIASLNGYYGGGWAEYASILEAVGADALELNVYYLAARVNVSGQHIEAMLLDFVRHVKSQVKTIPVAVKLSPYFSSMAHTAKQLDDMGVAGLTLFNRFYQPDINIETQAIRPSLDLSTSTELRLRLRWAAMLSHQINADLALTGGVHTVEDVIKSLMVGAKAVMVTAALYQKGIGYLADLNSALDRWLTEHEHTDLNRLRGCMSEKTAVNPAAFARANYMEVLATNNQSSNN
ncbi:MAG: dihydroorotate dehydrogenase-like protein [Chloroflexota bacterium]